MRLHHPVSGKPVDVPDHDRNLIAYYLREGFRELTGHHDEPDQVVTDPEPAPVDPEPPAEPPVEPDNVPDQTPDEPQPGEQSATETSPEK